MDAATFMSATPQMFAGSYDADPWRLDANYVPRIMTPRRPPTPVLPPSTPNHIQWPTFNTFPTFSTPAPQLVSVSPIVCPMTGPMAHLPFIPPLSADIYSQTGSPLWSPGTFPAQPFGTPVPIQLHPLLIVNPLNPLCPQLRWDVTRRPDTAKQLTGRELFVNPDLDQEATAQQTNKMLIYSTVPALAPWMARWGGIMVNEEEMTAYDVLEAIYNYLQTPLTWEDLELAAAADPNYMSKLNASAYSRIKSSSQLYLVDYAQGFKRADVLGDSRIFQGLRPVWCNGTWIALLELLPAPRH